MAQVNLPITSRTSSDDNDFADVVGNDQAIIDQVNGGLDNTNIDASAAIAYSKLNLSNSIVAGDIAAGAVGASEIATGAVGTDELATNAVGSDEITAEAVTGAKLADDVAGVYRTLLTGSGIYPQSEDADLFFAGANLGGVMTEAPTAASALLLVFLDDIDYLISGRTAQLRLRAQQTTVGTGPGTTLTVGLYPVTGISAGALQIGTVVSGSTVAFASTAANTRAQGNSGDFAIPAPDAYHVVGVSNSGTTAASSGHSLYFQLQVHHT